MQLKPNVIIIMIIAIIDISQETAETHKANGIFS